MAGGCEASIEMNLVVIYGMRKCAMKYLYTVREIILKALYLMV